MRIFFDTEFIEDGHTIDLISLGMVREDGSELYRVSADFDATRASPWVKDHVLPLISHEDRWARYLIANKVKTFCGTSPEFWGYYADYDWVVLCQLFGTMMELPTGWPCYCRDLRQSLDEVGLKKITSPKDDPHHALENARWIKTTWMYYHTPQTMGRE